jgi:hypothetical protein
MFRKAFVIRGLLMFLLVVDIIILSCQFATASYDVVSVTPLFFLYFANYLFPLSIFLAVIGIFASLTMMDKTLFTFSSLALYFVVLFIPYNLFHFPIYNDQLGFAVETLYGMRDGVVVPYQGEYSTLGHAFFTASAGEILGLNLFQATRFVEAVFVFACFVVYLSLAMSILKKNGAGGRSFLAATVIAIFPAFILEPLVYSRGYFGLVVFTVLLLSMFKFMEKSDAESSILATITFVASSISYPLQPLIVVIAMALLVLFSRFPASSGKNRDELHRAILKTLLFFVIWFTIQVYLGYASWNILHEIVWKALAQEFFTGFESAAALRYVGDAAVYTNLRILMVAVGWLMAAFIALAFIPNFLKNRDISGVELFAFSLIASFYFLGAVYGVTFHEPALRFYRNLVAAMPFALTYMTGKITVRSSLRKTVPALLFAITIVFLILGPVTKWGWTFVGYPTDHDVALCNHIISHYGSLPNSVLYAPGSHAMFGFFTKSVSMQTQSNLRIYEAGDVEFNLNNTVMADCTATFYRMYIYPRWFGEDIKITINEVKMYASQNNVLYTNGDLWLLIEKIT